LGEGWDDSYTTFIKTLFGAQAIILPTSLAIECLQIPCLQVDV